MAEDGDENTIPNVPAYLEALVINVTNDELKYRYKYLPDPRQLSDDKIVCTVCSTSLASRVRKGKVIYVHAILGVLVCKGCHTFYGDGIFSADEDGDDKYCRWCGQGGTLYLCSKCSCGFCKKCMMKNMKNSALTDIEKENWKCLICIPRPIFGSRAVCWAAQELNNTARKNQLLRQRLEEEKFKLQSESRLTEHEAETSNTSAQIGSKNKRRLHDTEDSDSSTVFIPAKKSKRDTRTNKSLNGSIKKHRRKEGNSSSVSELSENDHSSKSEKKNRRKKYHQRSSSSDESSKTSNKRRKKENSKKKPKPSLDETSDSEATIPKSKSSKEDKSLKTQRKKRSKTSTSDSSSNDSVNKSLKTQRKKRRKRSTSHSSSNDSVKKNRKKNTHNGRTLSSDTSSEEDTPTRTPDHKEKQDIAERKTTIKNSASPEETETDNTKTTNDNMELVSAPTLKLKANGKELENETLGVDEIQSFEKSDVGNAQAFEDASNISLDLENNIQTLQNSDQSKLNEALTSPQHIAPLNDNDNDFTLSYDESSDEVVKFSLSQEDEVQVKVHLAIEWLDAVSSEVADLGCLIAEQTNKFGEKKVNLENLRSYEDVMQTQEKLKHILQGIHTNYKQIEDSLEDKLKSWKILAGLEKCDLEEQLDGGGVETNTQGEIDCQGKIDAQGDMVTDNNNYTETETLDTNIEDTRIPGEDSQSELNKDKNDFGSEVTEPILPEEHKTQMENAEKSERLPTIDCKENHIETHDGIDTSINIPDSSINVQETFEIKTETVETESQPLKNEILEEAVSKNEDEEVMKDLNNEKIDEAMVKAELNLKSGSSKLIWSSLFSSDDDSDVNAEVAINPNDIGESATENNQKLSEIKESSNDILPENLTPLDKTETSDKANEISQGKEGESTKLDPENEEALQELLYSSTEPEIGSSETDSDDSDDLQLDESDLEDILKPRKVIVKKSTKKKEQKLKVESKNNSEDVINDQDEEKNNEEESDMKIETEKKAEEPLDSEAEIDMLTDLSKLKKKTVLRRVEEKDSSDESSSEDVEEENDDEDHDKRRENKKKRKKYNTEIKKKREQERNELFGFLQGDSSAEDEADITKDDLDKMEDQYVSESSDSMSLEAFSRKMNEKWRELENEQDQLNLQMLLASESDPDSIGGDGDDLVLDSEEDKKKKKGKQIKEEKVDEEKPANLEDNEQEETEVQVKDEKVEEAQPDQEYEQFLEDLAKTRTTFTGLGSSSEEDKDQDQEEIEIKEEALSDQDGDVKVKKERESSGEGTNSDSSADLFKDIKKKSEKKIWRQHKLLRMKLSDTDTSDEERWWQRRLEREKKKKEHDDSDNSEFDEIGQCQRPKKSSEQEKKKKEESNSEKENKKIKKEKHKEDEESNSSSTLEISSTESSGSDIFKRKKKKKKESSDSDIQIISDPDKKKKKKKKRMNLSGDSSDESGDSDDDVIDITQKSSQGESPGKGGRKNIRKVLTKHELAAATKAAAKEEEERKKRIAARQKLFNEMFEIKEAEILEKLVLDFDPDTKTELISVDKDLVIKMKPHQAKGVKFMWDSCFESLSQLKTKKGSGCILAHCMGLGKTFQVVSLVHTILTHKDTNVRTVLVVCPLSTVLNWYNEFDKWLEGVSGGRNIKIYHLTRYKKAHERSKQLSLWHRTGGVMVLGYEMFRILANSNSKKFRLMHKEIFQKTLIDPGADLVVCDEGHMLKNESTLLSKAMSRIRTLRRIVLTGTPMQNNLKEYHCMVQFVKPNLLGTRKEFLNQFVNPITNGQFVDSTEADVKVMKRRAHVLHKMLEGLVQRYDYSVLTPYLPPKQEYVISLRLSDVQVKLYQFYLDHFCQKSNSDDKRTSSQLFQDWQVLGRVWTHPRVLKMSSDKAEKERQESSDSEDEQKSLKSQKTIKDFFKKKSNSSSGSAKQESEDEGSIKDFINDKSSSSSLSLSSASSSDDEKGEKKDKTKKKKMEKKESNEPEKKKNPVNETPVDEINLISSEEEDGNKSEIIVVKSNQEGDIDNDNENKADDSGIEDQDGKTGDETKSAEDTVKTDTSEKDEKENKEDEKSENKEDEKLENKEEKSEKEKKKSEAEQLVRRGNWWKTMVEPHHLEDINQSAKLIILFAILRECEMIEDKVLVFSQSLFSLDMIEYFLEKVDRATEENRLDESLGNHAGCWQKGLDYFRLDGSSSSENRSAWCKSFNKEDNTRARLFLISTRAGGLGINLTGANRVIIFDASWNPSHDIQSIFRIYRFGQKKPCYVYRFVAHGTMEEKVYDRQVAKQLLSSRVVDEQQVQRHFSMNDLNELYTFTPPQERSEKPTPVLPKDRLMAELLTQYSDWIEKYHEHDSLLENIAEEELDEEERKLAWEDYNNEKKRGFLPTPGTGVTNVPGVTNQIELFRKSLKLKFPNATDIEMNAMLQTLMYQVNYRALSQQLSVGAQNQPPQGQQVNAGPSQQQQNFRGMNSNIRSSQSFNQMVNQMYQKNYEAQSTQQQRIASNQMNPQRIGYGTMNQQMVGNGQIRKNNKTSQEIYMEQMRKQQEANLARIRNQKRFQQQALQNTGQPQIQQRNTMRQAHVNNQSTTQQQIQQRNTMRQMPVDKRNTGQQQIQQRNIMRQARNDTRMQQQSNRPPAVISKVINRQAPPPAPMQSRTPQPQNLWKPNRPQPPVTNRMMQMQKQRQNAVTTLNRQRQMQVTPITNMAKPVPSNTLSTTQWKTNQQKAQEEMRQRVKELQRQKNQQALRQRLQQTGQKGGSIDLTQQQQRLEEMKKRYNASRMKRMNSGGSSNPISIVEIDDEPGT